jgi:homoserine dehydrogenase
MLSTINIIQLGVGGVGRALIEQVLSTAPAQARHGLHFRYVALADSGGVVAGPHGLDSEVVRGVAAWKAGGRPLSEHASGHASDPAFGWMARLLAPGTLLVDTTASGALLPAFESVLRQEGGVVLANKKPLAGSWEEWERLMREGRTGYEATVGAGLPVISTLSQLVDTGDTVTRIDGNFSGTLGYLMSELQAGTPFSAAVRAAKANGWTEPDPRDDLGGVDIARKALILARTAGWRFELEDVEVHPLYPPEWARLTVDDFMARLEELDETVAGPVAAAAANGERLRYVATVTPEALKVGLSPVPAASPLGALVGSDNLIAFHSERYGPRPLVVQGAGAGTELTASAVLVDMLRLAPRLSR